MAKDLGLAFLETSAENGSNVGAAFESVIEVVFKLGFGRKKRRGSNSSEDEMVLGSGIRLEHFLEEDDVIEPTQKEKQCARLGCC